uniref:Uncharacterized protein n=1 Tax=Anguilla anguilla TaxID=7936 RepID=A0A0E9UML4_ANGAN
MRFKATSGTCCSSSTSCLHSKIRYCFFTFQYIFRSNPFSVFPAHVFGSF